jgi:hypothetical protein
MKSTLLLVLSTAVFIGWLHALFALSNGLLIKVQSMLT